MIQQLGAAVATAPVVPWFIFSDENTLTQVAVGVSPAACRADAL